MPFLLGLRRAGWVSVWWEVFSKARQWDQGRGPKPCLRLGKRAFMMPCLHPVCPRAHPARLGHRVDSCSKATLPGPVIFLGHTSLDTSQSLEFWVVRLNPVQQLPPKPSPARTFPAPSAFLPCLGLSVPSDPRLFFLPLPWGARRWWLLLAIWLTFWKGRGEWQHLLGAASLLHLLLYLCTVPVPPSPLPSGGGLRQKAAPTGAALISLTLRLFPPRT